jgi:hypothetical protein
VIPKAAYILESKMHKHKQKLHVESAFAFAPKRSRFEFMSSSIKKNAYPGNDQPACLPYKMHYLWRHVFASQSNGHATSGSAIGRTI